ncbi:hypothetical protein GWK41_01090 [Persephonella atlantica]|uniref:GGDEF domain-containing protein n=1 Tax=Persephonella atlantica TaxID=2699429 RepID=A0ABS1GFG0_9AQUI|nr:hypothetical protein [Persephonella atlantica]MBK3331657.1 hypothetical protein [Persephonella atlantica]
MTVEISFQDFKKFIQFELSHIKRFNCPEVFSIGFLKPEKTEMFENLKNIVKEALRETDVISTYNHSIFVILPGTDSKGAEFISRAIFDFFNGEVIEVYVEYPDDGKNLEELLDALDRKTRKKFGYILEKIFRQ